MSPIDVRARTADDPPDVAAFLARALGVILTAGGALGTAAAFALILDRIALLEDPSFIPACSIDAVLSCGSVMTSPQAEVLGFPNPLIGMITFPVVATLGVVVVSGAAIPRWVWLGLQAGTLAGVLFVHWLIGQSLYSIGALCPYCIAVWVVTITVFWYVTIGNIAAGRLPTGIFSGPARIATTYHGALLTAWLLTIAALAVLRFWPQWSGAAT